MKNEHLNADNQQTTTHAGTTDILIDMQRFAPVSVSAELDLSKPLPLRIKIDLENPNLWAAKSANYPDSQGNHTAYVFSTAEIAQNYLRGLDPDYQLLQDQIREARRLLNSKAIPADQYEGWLCDGEDYYASIQDYLESLDEDPASPWLYATHKMGFDYDLERQIDSYLEDNHHEDAANQLVDISSLQAFWKEWKAKQDLTTYHCDYLKIVVLDRERFDADIADAKALLEAHK